MCACERFSQSVASGGRGKWFPVRLIQCNGFIDDDAQLVENLALVIAVAATEDQARSAADQARVFVARLIYRASDGFDLIRLGVPPRVARS